MSDQFKTTSDRCEMSWPKRPGLGQTYHDTTSGNTFRYDGFQWQPWPGIPDNAGVDRWQEFECPACGFDYDFHDDQRVRPGERFQCSGCNQWFDASVAWITEYARDNSKNLNEDGYLSVVPIGTFLQELLTNSNNC